MSSSSSSIDQATLELKNDDTHRPVADFTPSLWGDTFLNYSPLRDQATRVAMEEEARGLELQLKDEFERLLAKAAADKESSKLLMYDELMSLIDNVERLGVAYRFHLKIEEALHTIFTSYSTALQTANGSCEEDLHRTSLRFRLLRQHGFHVPSDVFQIFKDDDRVRFKASLASDVQGMLSLYDASHLRVHGEGILDEALAFTTLHLKSLIASCDLSPRLSSLVTRSLKIPVHKAMIRLESRDYISIYEQDPTHNKTLLRFAKLEFNLLQSLYKEELMHLSRWWKDMDMTSTLPFTVRDRIVELYFWGLGALYEPQYSFTRMIFVKTVQLISILDDIYDAYGVIDELEQFHLALEKWDISCTDKIPKYMNQVFEAFFNTYKEIEHCLAAEGRSHLIRYVIEETVDMSRVYLQEARWRHNKYTPTYDEYMRKAATLSFGNNWALAVCFAGMGEVASEGAFKWLRRNPCVVEGGGRHGRLLNDMVSRQFERDRCHIPSAVECYMKEHGATRGETHREFHAQLQGVWKDINQAMLRPTIIPTALLRIQLNFDRLVNLVYNEDDGYTFPEKSMKHHMASVLIHPIP